jgi:hypothetical protein
MRYFRKGIFSPNIERNIGCYQLGQLDNCTHVSQGGLKQAAPQPFLLSSAARGPHLHHLSCTSASSEKDGAFHRWLVPGASPRPLRRRSGLQGSAAHHCSSLLRQAAQEVLLLGHLHGGKQSILILCTLLAVVSTSSRK